MTMLEDIRTSVGSKPGVSEAVVTLMQELAQRLKNAVANNDQAVIEELLNDMHENAQLLADSVVAGTPAAPAQPQSGTGTSSTPKELVKPAAPSPTRPYASANHTPPSSTSSSSAPKDKDK